MIAAKSRNHFVITRPKGRCADALHLCDTSAHHRSANEIHFANLSATRYLPTIGLLLISNTFMTIAWYGHLKFERVPLWKVILVAWSIAFFEYVFQVPANRIGIEHGLSGGQLKIIQEAVTLVVFVIFARLYLGERLA